jgi:hypothetical protein
MRRLYPAARFWRLLIASVRNGKAVLAASACAGLVIAALATVDRSGSPSRKPHNQNAGTTSEQGKSSTSPVSAQLLLRPADHAAVRTPTAQWLEEASDEPASSVQLEPYFDALLQQAREGDLRAAQVLHQSLGNCHGRLADLGADIPAQEDGVQRTRRHRAEQCRGFTRAQLRLDEEIVRAAADRGDDAMRIAYYNLDPVLDGDDSPEALQRYRATALVYLNEAASHRNPAAYWALSDAYTVGRVVDRDPVLARAYALASNAQPSDDDSPQARLIASQILAGHWP